MQSIWDKGRKLAVPGGVLVAVAVVMLAMSAPVVAASTGAVSRQSAPRASSTASAKSVTYVADVGGLDDHGYNEYTWLGVEIGAKANHVADHVIQTTDASQYSQNITTAAEQSKLVVISGFDMADQLQTVSARYPKDDFAILDYSYSPPLKNVQCDVFQAQESSYLAGIVAAGMSKSHVIGFVGGEKEAVLEAFLAGYEAGALAEYPKTTIKVEWTGSFTDEDAGKAAAQAEIAENADVIYTAAGASGIGGIYAAKAAHVWAIGVDADQNYLAPQTVVTSAIKELSVTAQGNIKTYVDGTWKSGNKTLDLANGGVGLAPFHGLAKDVPAQVKSEIKTATAHIISKKLVVPTTPKYPNGN